MTSSDGVAPSTSESIPLEQRPTFRLTALSHDLDLADIAALWRRGSVIGSWLLDFTAASLLNKLGLDDSGRVSASGESFRPILEGAIERIGKERNGAGEGVISAAAGRVAVRVIRTNEELTIARSVCWVLGLDVNA